MPFSIRTQQTELSIVLVNGRVAIWWYSISRNVCLFLILILSLGVVCVCVCTYEKRFSAKYTDNFDHNICTKFFIKMCDANSFIHAALPWILLFFSLFYSIAVLTRNAMRCISLTSPGNSAVVLKWFYFSAGIVLSIDSRIISIIVPSSFKVIIFHFLSTLIEYSQHEQVWKTGKKISRVSALGRWELTAKKIINRH